MSQEIPRGQEILLTSHPLRTRKKPRTEATRYNQVVSCIKVVILSKEHLHEELKAVYCEKLIISLMDLLCENNAGDQTINFCGYTIRSAAMEMNCEDEGSKDWLTHSINKLTLWEG